MEKGNFVFDLKHFWDALQTFYTFFFFFFGGGEGDFGGCLGRVSVNTTVNKSEMLDKHPRQSSTNAFKKGSQLL